MNTLRMLILTSVLFGSLVSCKKDNGDDPNPTVDSRTELLVANNWRTAKVTTPDGQEINRNRLGLTTQVLFDLDMQFRKDGSVRALDYNRSNSVVNGGSWKLTADSQSMDVDVQGFKGNFPIIQLNKSKLILRQSAPVDGKTSDINLEFNPTL
ncbi:hypothetical protein GCM10028819_31750 [Spirosoma humi]